MGGSKKATIGYRYFMGLHFGLCHGPVDALMEIRGGDRRAWNGEGFSYITNPFQRAIITAIRNVDGSYLVPPQEIPPGYGVTTIPATGEITTSQRITIHAPNLWGGEKKEGGIQGEMDVMMGEPSQGPNDYLQAHIPGPMPSFRGILSLVFRGGLVGCMSPYPKPWKFKVRRILKGWKGGSAWYPAKAEIDLGLGNTKAMNPAHIVYEALTNAEWGMGYPDGILDLPSFQAAADTFHAEGMGLCLQWVREDTIEGFVQDVMNHVGATCGQDPRTGKFRLIPIRGGYTVASLPEFRRGLNVLSIDSYQVAAVTELVNEITAKFVDVSTGKTGLVTVQQLANIQAQGGVSPAVINYPGLPTLALAERVALRDLEARSSPLCKVRLTVDRGAYGLLPGEVVRWSDAKLGIVDMPLRVLRVNYGNLTQGAIQLDLAQDVFGLPLTGYLGQQPSGWESPTTRPQPAAAVEGFEVPYVALLRGGMLQSDLDSLPASAGFVGLAAAQPLTGTSYGFGVYTRIGTASFESRGHGDWSAGGAMSASVNATAVSITLDAPRGFADLEPGMLAMLGTGNLAELVRIDTGNPTSGVVTLARGLGDTTPRPWPAGTRLWVLEDAAGMDQTEYATGEVVDAKAATEAPEGELDLATATGDSVTMAQRLARPYPPGHLRLAALFDPVVATPYPDTDVWGLSLTASWVHRDRKLQGDQLVPHNAGSTGPEAGTTYTARWYVNGVLAQTNAGLPASTVSDVFAPPTGSGGKTLRVEVDAVRDGLASWQSAAHSFLYRATLITESGALRLVSEAGEPIILE